MEARPIRRAPGSSPIHLSVVGLLSAAVLFAVLVLSPFHPRSVEWNPSHGHVVMGGDDHERAQALVRHLQNESRHSGPGTDRNGESEQCDVDSPTETCVLSIRAGTAAAVTALGISGGIVAMAHDDTVRPNAPVGKLRLFREHSVARLALPVPDPPPRAI